jgi:kexin
VRDSIQNDKKGTFVDWHLKLWGVAIDAAKAKLLPMPTEEDDDDHAKIATITQPAITTSLGPHPDASKTAVATELPSDHPHRPTKPTGESSATGTDAPAASSSSEASTWVPSFLPTFGASPNTVAWIYGSIGLIVLFVCGLGIWWWIVRRRRLRNNSRDNYEFELLNEEETEGLNGGNREKGQRRRGGELYDAFAGGSDEEDDAQPYADRDEPQHHTIGSDDEDDDDDDDGNNVGETSRLKASRS